jgi:uncharacterized protein YprB with RNaseH-like and TPR domain
MSELSDRLRRLGAGRGGAQDPVGKNPVRAERLASDSWNAWGAKLVHNRFGEYVLRRVAYPSDHRHGRCPLNDLVGRSQSLSVLSTQEVEGHKRLLFLDTETTGLGVGAGNVAFMIGVGFFTESEFCVEQYFLRSPAEESAMLHDLRQRMSGFTHLVTFNGRSFDWPILLNRFVMHRMRGEHERIAHIDCLYPARSLWKHLLPNCRLAVVEQARLGFVRQDDVPGSMAPTLYMKYLYDGQAEWLKGVFLHNEADVVSLAALSAHYSMLLSDFNNAGCPQMSSGELYRLGLWYDKVGKPELSRRCMEELIACAWYGDYELLPQLAAWYKKSRLHDQAARLWRRQMEVSSPRSLDYKVCIELSMYYEHHDKHYNDALNYAEEALGKLRRRSALSRVDNEPERLQIERRIHRLRKKVSNQAKRKGLFG